MLEQEPPNPVRRLHPALLALPRFEIQIPNRPHPGQFVTTADNSLRDALRDRYTLDRQIGRGGMATVYLVRDLRHNRWVALKLLHPELAYLLGPAEDRGRVLLVWAREPAGPWRIARALVNSSLAQSPLH